MQAFLNSSNEEVDIKETLYDSSVTRVQRCIYNGTPVIIKSTAQDIPDESLIGQYHTSGLAQNQVDHPAVNKVIKEISEGAGRSLILEDIGGITFKEWIKATGTEYSRWPLEDPAIYHSWMLRLLRWSISLSEGISACHQQNIIHNDINPANVIVNPNTDQVQLIDFGAAFPDGANIHEWTVVEQHRTLTYISPEQTGRLNRNIDYRSDYYALGATLYQVFSSLPPFIAHDLPELIHCHIARHPVPLDIINPLIPESLSALVAKLMAKAPEDRYQNGRCLIQDLKAIEHALVSGIPFPLSELGKNDVPEQLLIPAKLYGREQELATLQKALNSHHDKPALIAVEGEAGGGKTTLITEAILHTVDFSYQLLSGKSDAYNKKPHNALSQALAKSAELLLSMPEDQFIPWRLTLLEALNQNPHTLISLCPELATVFETAVFSEKALLHNADIQLKLHTSIFLQHLSALDPILLFIDDVQWCDGPSIALLEAVINANHPRITVMVTCRSEEIDDSHPYSLMKKTIQENSIALVIINLVNLGFLQITQLLEATFHIEKDRLEELAKILLKKTLGNPLFVHEFLKAAHHDNHKTLYYDNQQGRWGWDKQRLKQIATSGNVAALLIDALHQQDYTTQDLLQWAACIGTRFNETLLAKVTKTSIVDIKEHLNAVYREGYIHRIADQQGNYAFNHDRIRQAYYELLPRGDLSRRHWVIGQACTEKHGRCDPLPHFLAALRGGLHPEMLCDENSITKITDAFYNGALSAKEKTANDIALQYIQCAIDIVETTRGGDVVQLSRFFLLQGELAYLTADIQLGSDGFDRYRLMNGNVTLQAASFSQQAPLAFMRGDIEASINCSLNCFRLLGVDTPLFGGDITDQLNDQRERFNTAGGLGAISKIPDSCESIDTRSTILQSTATTVLLLLGVEARYEWAEWFGLVGMNDSLSNGFSKSTLQLWSLFDAIILSSNHNKFDQTIVERSLNILEKNNDFSGVGFVFVNVGAYSGRYSQPMMNCLSSLEEGAKESFEIGEYLPYIACFSNKIVVSFSSGLPLPKIQEYISSFHDFLLSCGNVVVAGRYYSKLLDQLVSPSSLDFLDKNYFSKKEWGVLSNSAAFGVYHHLRLQNYFWHTQYRDVLNYYRKEKGELYRLRGMAPVDDNAFLYAISCLRCGEVEGREFRESVASIEELASVFPPNFRHKVLLIEAENCRLNGDSKASERYQRAAIDAKENGFIQMYSLAHELHAYYWQEQGRPDYAKYHVTKAMQGYQRWGCALKLEQLYNYFGQALDFQSYLSSWIPISQPQLITASYDYVRTPNIQRQKALLRIVNMVTGELTLDQRLMQIVQLTVENTEAERGVLLLACGGDYKPKTVADVVKENQDRGSIVFNVTDGLELTLPNALIARCAEQKKSLLVKCADVNVGISDEVFFQSTNVQSLLCYPIMYKGQCQSLLLLTHEQEDAFSRQDLQFLNTLGPQFSVSIENARLYQERQRFNCLLEQKVEQRTQELQAANEELEAFTASVTHDLKAPLRAISGFTAALFEDYDERLSITGQNYVNMLMEASGKMGGIIDGLLVLSRYTQSTLVWEEVNVSTLVEDKLRWLRTMEPEHHTSVSIQHGLTVSGDLRLIRQVVDNLVGNAWKYSHRAKKPEIHFGMMVTHKSPYTFYIRDNGVGFDASNADELFVPFRRFHLASEFEGTGIGLATVYRIIRRHGGSVWVNSDVGKGAIFYFTFSNGDAL
ncbi:hypothetical protein A9Q81_27110 [Gammaproteobacteria bacterium 42_54_T18]|nr:hypothetical protein A9Q81_27110 [Gammaproteobacteria bacterium 42_54_T18]